MKLSKFATTALFACSLASMAHAQTVVRIVGSTAFRGSAHNAILHIFDSAPSYAYDKTSLGGAANAIFSGNIGGNPVIIKTHWTGSEGGIQTVARPSVTDYPLNFFSSSVTMSTAGTNDTTAADVNDTNTPDITFSDTYQAASVFKGTYQGKTYSTLAFPALSSGIASEDLGDGIVGVVAFKFLASKGSTITDITTQNARNLFKAGAMSQALLTGSAADESTTVYAIGRDFDSGTRLTTMAETGIGAKSSVKQYMPSKVVGSTSAGDRCTAITDTMADIVAWPAGSVNGVSYLAYNGGYNSGGELCKGIACTPPAGKALIGYAGQADADGSGQGIAAGAVELSYNGVKLGNLAANASLIAEGKYTFWGYEHIYYNNAANATVQTVAQRLMDQLVDGTYTAGVPDAPLPLLKNMRVNRLSDGGVVSQNF